MPKSTKLAKASTSLVEETQEESSAQKESSSSDQEKDQPSQAQGVPNMTCPTLNVLKWIGQ